MLVYFCVYVVSASRELFNLQNDPENDRMISDHILCMHRYRSPREQDGEGMTGFSQKAAIFF